MLPLHPVFFFLECWNFLTLASQLYFALCHNTVYFMNQKKHYDFMNYDFMKASLVAYIIVYIYYIYYTSKVHRYNLTVPLPSTRTAKQTLSYIYGDKQFVPRTEEKARTYTFLGQQVMQPPLTVNAVYFLNTTLHVVTHTNCNH